MKKKKMKMGTLREREGRDSPAWWRLQRGKNLQPNNTLLVVHPPHQPRNARVSERSDTLPIPTRDENERPLPADGQVRQIQNVLLSDGSERKPHTPVTLPCIRRLKELVVALNKVTSDKFNIVLTKVIQTCGVLVRA
jgi:hypothetical protein